MTTKKGASHFLKKTTRQREVIYECGLNEDGNKSSFYIKFNYGGNFLLSVVNDVLTKDKPYDKIDEVPESTDDELKNNTPFECSSISHKKMNSNRNAPFSNL